MDSKPINTVPEAVDFLRTTDLEVIGIWHGWIIHGTAEDNFDFKLTCDTNAELIQYARDERDMCVWICGELGVASLADIPRGDSSSSMPVDTPSSQHLDGNATESMIENSKEAKK
jgi:hypothetical protein